MFSVEREVPSASQFSVLFPLSSRFLSGAGPARRVSPRGTLGLVQGGDVSTGSPATSDARPAPLFLPRADVDGPRACWRGPGLPLQGLAAEITLLFG